MKKSIVSITAIFALTLFITFSACEKECPIGPAGERGEQGLQGTKGTKGDKGDTGARGATGPRGATGARGATGPKGSTGATGPRGTTGSRGATGPRGTTGTVNVIYSEWLTVNLQPASFGYYAKLIVPKITQSILDKGDIRMYLSLPDNKILSIPNPTIQGLHYECGLGAIEIFSPAAWDSASGYDYRYVIIPGGVAAKARAQGLNLKDFSAVSTAFNIPE